MKHFYESPRYDDGTCQIVITEAILCDAKEKLFRRNSNSNSNEEEEEEEEEDEDDDDDDDDDDDNDDYYREPIPDRFLARSYDVRENQERFVGHPSIFITSICSQANSTFGASTIIENLLN
uniref:Uncharacterized protein n=1 Tax=Vespula pensylvanica TaxID=30213 RepID=A0A834UGI1_VESPE|nr:hypothetical protein H0235_000725 [Vespula pensylvanica]